MTISTQAIDSHIHYWQVQRGDYSWLTESMTSLYRDFLPHDLEPLQREVKVRGSIVVQAAPTVAETAFLLALAAQHPKILGVVGWTDLTGADVKITLERLARDPKLCGIRPMLQDLPDDWLVTSAINAGICALQRLGLAFDALVFPRHLPYLRTFLERYPDLRVVIDHGAKPAIRERQWEPWASEIAALSSNPRVHCKLSGLTTEAEPDCPWPIYERYISHLFQCFGPQRMMWGSDFPVLKINGDYYTWYAACELYVERHFPGTHPAVFSQNASRFYRIG